jgi:chemotaxis response regulator CheB/chemotaxis methyl-accepting protein methylase
MAGIQLGQRQVAMVENRLKARMVKLGLKNFTSYLSYLKSHQEQESQALLSLMTTHHTYFFREFSHFEFLLNKGLDRMIQKAKARGDNKIRIWSAASSRGQEAFSLAMFFQFHLAQANAGVDFEIYGTDIDPESVQHAKNGVYKAEELKQSPAMYIGDNWIRGTGNVKDFSKLKDQLKSKCKFETVNLLKPQSFLAGKNFDLIFCRNVYIYFNQEQIKHCSVEMLSHLDSDGFLFLGVSESLNGLNLKIENSGPSVYQHPRPVQTFKSEPKKQIAMSIPQTKRPIEVLCVDDSKAILTLLGSILNKDSGFIVKATAANGLQALEKIKNEKFDVITLDMHMPELDGVGFLEKTKGMNRPPVIVVSSINRDDTSIAQKAMQLGAVDYVEKPSLENIGQAGNEIRAKLKMAMAMNPNSSSSTAPTENLVSMKGKTKVLIVDDSKTIRQLLFKILSEDPQIEIVAETDKPLEVEKLIEKHKPDVITLDIHMPDMDGVTLLKRIQPKFQIPTVMISSISKEEGRQVLDALEAGAIDYIQKPSMSDLRDVASQIRDRIKIAAIAKVRKKKSVARRTVSSALVDKQSLIVMGSSTGGTEAVREILQTMPSEIPPILIVQHIPAVFSAAFANRLNDLCPFEVKEAAHGDEIKPNRVLIAPGGKQMGVKAVKDKLIISITDDQPVNRHKPSVDYLFQSVADLGSKKVVSIILTGMGADGARSMKKLKDQGIKTIAQDKESCVVFGMPREAIEMGGVDFVLPLDQIAVKIIELCSQFTIKKAS